jgi:hypothetical protein
MLHHRDALDQHPQSVAICARTFATDSSHVSIRAFRFASLARRRR